MLKCWNEAKIGGDGELGSWDGSLRACCYTAAGG
jgi:hypothetical protein